MIARALGDRAAVLDWLTWAVDERSHLRAFVHVDPQLASLRDAALRGADAPTRRRQRWGGTGGASLTGEPNVRAR